MKCVFCGTKIWPWQYVCNYCKDDGRWVEPLIPNEQGQKENRLLDRVDIPRSKIHGAMNEQSQSEPGSERMKCPKCGFIKEHINDDCPKCAIREKVKRWNEQYQKEEGE